MRLTRRREALFGAAPALAALTAGCELAGQQAAAPTPTNAPAAPGPSPTTARPETVLTFSNSPPHIVEINATTNQIVRTKDVPNLGVWATNDDNCYYDGTNVWLGARNPGTSDVEVFLLNLDTLEVGRRIPLGKDTNTVYIGKGSLRTNQLWIAKHGSSEVAVVDTNTMAVLEIKSVPTNGGVACDMDVITGPDGIERAYIPTNNGDTTFSINTATRQVETVYEHTRGVSPYMLTCSPDGRFIWVQERTTDGNLVLDYKTLQPVKHVPTGRGAFVNTFSPDGRLCYVSHSQDTRMVVVEANPPFNLVKEIEVGTNAQVTAPLASGRAVYTIANRESSVSAISTANWAVTAKIQLPENPAFVFARPASRR
jgi:hypothetical protein